MADWPSFGPTRIIISELLLRASVHPCGGNRLLIKIIAHSISKSDPKQALPDNLILFAESAGYWQPVRRKYDRQVCFSDLLTIIPKRVLPA